jgi:hypothetical protein
MKKPVVVPGGGNLKRGIPAGSAGSLAGWPADGSATALVARRQVVKIDRMPMQLEANKQLFTHNDNTYTVTCFHETDNPHPLYRFIVDQQRGEWFTEAFDSYLQFDGEGAPKMNAYVQVSPLLNRVAERIAETIRAGRAVPRILDRSYWR